MSRKFILSERAMLVRLTLSKWNGRMVDDEATNELLEDKKAASDAASLVKQLVPREALADITFCFNRARNAFKRKTLPWDNGVGIVRAEGFEPLAIEMAGLGEEYMGAGKTFARSVYPALLRSGAERTRLGDLYRESDFPTPEEMEAKFAFDFKGLPIPTKADFRVDLGNEATNAVRRGIEEHVTERLQQAQRALWLRVLEVVKHFGEKMKDGDKFKDATITNLIDITEEAAAMAVAPDPQLAAVCAEVRALAKLAPADKLRTDTKTRTKAAKAAAAQVARIEKLMKGAF